LKRRIKSVDIQVIIKMGGMDKVFEIIGCATKRQDINFLKIIKNG